MRSSRLIVPAAGLLAGIAIGWLVSGWHHDARRVAALEAAQRAYEVEIAVRDAEIERQRRIAYDASESYQQELAALRAERDRAPARIVRLCIESADAVPSADAAESASRSDAASARSGHLPEGAGPADRAGADIGPGLYRLADRCDDLAAQLTGLQRWVRQAYQRQH